MGTWPKIPVCGTRPTDRPDGQPGIAGRFLRGSAVRSFAPLRWMQLTGDPFLVRAVSGGDFVFRGGGFGGRGFLLGGKDFRGPVAIDAAGFAIVEGEDGDGVFFAEG